MCTLEGLDRTHHIKRMMSPSYYIYIYIYIYIYTCIYTCIYVYIHNKPMKSNYCTPSLSLFVSLCISLSVSLLLSVSLILYPSLFFFHPSPSLLSLIFSSPPLPPFLFLIASLIVSLANMEGDESLDVSFLGSADSVTQERICDDELILIKG